MSSGHSPTTAPPPSIPSHSPPYRGESHRSPRFSRNHVHSFSMCGLLCRRGSTAIGIQCRSPGPLCSFPPRPRSRTALLDLSAVGEARLVLLLRVVGRDTTTIHQRHRGPAVGEARPGLLFSMAGEARLTTLLYATVEVSCRTSPPSVLSQSASLRRRGPSPPPGGPSQRYSPSPGEAPIRPPPLYLRDGAPTHGEINSIGVDIHTGICIC